MNLYHYCSIEAFHSIISNREIRLSSLSLSNDSMEGQIVEREFLNLAKEDRFSNEQIEGLKRILSEFTQNADGLGFCLSEERDLLSQWRGYANDGYGVSIGFSKEYLELLSDSFKWDPLSKSPKNPLLRSFNLEKVIYEPAEQKLHLTPTYQKFKKNLDLTIEAFEYTAIRENIDALFPLINLVGAIYLLKSSAFGEEIEWRLISLLTNNDLKNPEACLFHPCSNKLKPYRSYPLTILEINPIDEIVLGPKNSTPIHVMDSFLRQKGFTDVQVSKCQGQSKFVPVWRSKSVPLGLKNIGY
jgi:hypothetical protein